MLTTIQTVKDELGIKAENRDYDALIARNLKSTCARVRQQTNRWIHWAADNFNVADGPVSGLLPHYYSPMETPMVMTVTRC